ncbi:uncharacterized protein PG986_012930 [Apiospora aurea]|uniref:Cytochrome P450 n=1 Tax=Apiospora aurea TaxID=335848 RepID=A0ABR1Q1E2_9PEZI
MTPGTRGIIEKTFAREIGIGKCVNVLSLSKIVTTKISAYAFFGMDYVDDDEFIDAAYYYNEDVLFGSELLRLTPKFLVPFTGPLMKVFLKRQRTFFMGLVSIIEQRMSSSDSKKKYNDVIQWIIDTSPKSKPWTPGRMAFEVMAIWFGSVQGLATTLTFAIYHLCDNPEYLEVLREESMMEFTANKRTVTGRRCALRDLTFSDGTKVAKGEWVGIPVGPMLRDASMYPHPDVFDPFRFIDSKLRRGTTCIQPDGPSKFTDVSDTWHVWGTGKMTCPGRFFVSFAMKHTLHYILENYDLEMAQKSRKKTINWRTLTFPALGVKVNFKARP